MPFQEEGCYIKVVYVHMFYLFIYIFSCGNQVRLSFCLHVYIIELSIKLQVGRNKAFWFMNSPLFIRMYPKHIQINLLTSVLKH